LGTGRIHQFNFRDDYLVSFEIRGIPGSEMELMQRLKLHLTKGGIVTLTSSNVLADSIYATCTLAPGTKPSIQFSDRVLQQYTMGFVLRGSTPATSDIISPAFIPGLKLWLHADTISAVDEDFVSTWLDSSGNDYHAVQSDSTRQPRYIENVFGDKPGVEFDAGTAGSGDYMMTPTIINPVTLGSTLFLLAKQTGGQTEHGNILGLPDATGQNSSDTRIYGTSNDVDKLFWTNPGVELGSGITAGFILALSIASASSATPYYKSTIAGTAFNPNDAIDVLKRVCLGRDHISGNSSNSTLGQVLLYEGVLSAANRAYVMNYLSSWSGIALGPISSPAVGSMVMTGYPPTVTTA
jgi:hypothetical protein